MPFGDDKRQLVPYRLDEKNILWGAAVYSREVSNYERELEARFALPQADIDWIEKEISTQYWKNWKEGIGYLGLGLGVFAGFVWAVGWIVRGFMGIPRGMDRKPSNSA